MRIKLKKTAAFIALVLAACMLCGCGFTQELGELVQTFREESALREREQGMVAFEDMEYTRPDMDEAKTVFYNAERGFENKISCNDMESLLDKCYIFYYDFSTMYTIANIRYCHNTTDTYYAQELSWCDDNSYVLSQMFDKLFYSCAESEIAEELEEDYFWEGFAEDYSDRSQSSYTDESVTLMQEESALVTEYRQLAASPTLTINGVETDFNSALAEAQGEEYNALISAYYRQYSPKFADIYIRLVRVRQELAQVLGYDSYEQMQYDYGFSRDYTSEQAWEYIEDIKEYIVPYYISLMQTLPDSGLTSYSFDNEELRKLLETTVEGMSGDIKTAGTFMMKYNLCDLSVDSNKANMSFQTYIENYDAPYLFLDSNGTSEDIISLFHEFGHYVDAFVNYNAEETTDVCETLSQGMEFLALSCMEDIVKPQLIEEIRHLKMLDALTLYVQQASFAEFESRVYAAEPEELSARWLAELSLETSREYGYFQEGAEEYYAYSWIDIPHFFESPFYIITYPVTNDIAMQVYELEQEEKGAGMEEYLKLLPREYSGFMDTISAAGFESPFAEGRIQKVRADFEAYFGAAA